MQINTTTIVVLAFSAVCLADTIHRGRYGRSFLSGRDLESFDLVKRQSGNYYRSLVSGMMRSHSLLGFFNTLPCDIISSLETNENEAENFFTSVSNGETPDILKDIENIPTSIISGLEDLVSVATQLPGEIISGVEAVVTEAVDIFNAVETGGIVPGLEDLGDIITSEAVQFWDGITDAGKDIWCEIAGCTTTPGSCFQQDQSPQTTTDVAASTTEASSTTTDSAAEESASEAAQASASAAASGASSLAVQTTSLVASITSPTAGAVASSSSMSPTTEGTTPTGQPGALSSSAAPPSESSSSATGSKAATIMPGSSGLRSVWVGGFLASVLAVFLVAL